jgi:hypothetical protein
MCVTNYDTEFNLLKISSSLSSASAVSNGTYTTDQYSINPLEFQDYDLSDDEGSTGVDFEWIAKFIPSITIYSITFVMGFFGNLLVINLKFWLSYCIFKKNTSITNTYQSRKVIVSIFYLKKLQSITNMFLVSLATADFLLIIICVPIKIIEFFTHRWLFGSFMCKLFHYMQFFTAICSVINLISMSLGKFNVQVQ